MGESAPILSAPAAFLGGLSPAPAPDPVAVTPMPDAAPTPLAPPADPEAATGRLRRLGWYALAFVVSSLLVAVGLRLDEVDLHAPFYYDEDSLLIMPMVKATLERGNHWRNERMGYPGVLELHDFPVVDHLHFALIWLLGRVIPDWVVVYNVYYLLGYPLAHLTAMAVFRHFRLSFPAAFTGGLLFAFLPYHYMRGESHYFLSAYWMVPVSLMAALWVCKGDLPFFDKFDGRYRLALWRWRSLGAVAIGLLTASAGAYYAYFACALYLAAALYGWVALRTWKAAASGFLLIAVVVAGGIANHLPAFAYQYQWGRNSMPTARLSEEAEIYGLKIAHMILPGNEHNSAVFAKLKSMYNTDPRPLQNENERATLGLIGTAGLIGLFAVLVLPVRRAWPYGPLAALVGFAVLIGTIGGFGSVFNQLVLNQVRCYNRISVYIAFLCLFAVLWTVDRWLASRSGSARRLAVPLFFALIVLGVWDQTSFMWFRPKVVEVVGKEGRRWRVDDGYYKEIETRLGPGGKVFTLPFVCYPESDWTQKLPSYEHARGYLHTNTLVWSFGAMKGREADAWQREVAVLPAGRMLERLCLRGFDGLVIDKRGYTPKRAQDRVKEVADALGAQSAPRLAHPDGHQVFFDLRPFRENWLKRQYGAEGFDRLARREAEAVSVLWLHGFHSFEPAGSENHHRWCSDKGTVLVVNPTDRPRTFRATMTVRAAAKGEFGVSITGLIDDAFAAEKTSPPRTYAMVVPPGRHAITFRCDPPDDFYSTDSRYLCFYIADFTKEEIE